MRFNARLAIEEASDGEYSLHASHLAATAHLEKRIRKLERELWVVAECIFQNVSAGEAKMWAEGIKVTIDGDGPPKFILALETERDTLERSRSISIYRALFKTIPIDRRCRECNKAFEASTAKPGGENGN